MPDQVHMKYKHSCFLLFEPVVFLDGTIANPYLGERETIRFHILIMLLGPSKNAATPPLLDPVKCIAFGVSDTHLSVILKVPTT